MAFQQTWGRKKPYLASIKRWPLDGSQIKLSFFCVLGKPVRLGEAANSWAAAHWVHAEVGHTVLAQPLLRGSIWESERSRGLGIWDLTLKTGSKTVGTWQITLILSLPWTPRRLKKQLLLKLSLMDSEKGQVGALSALYLRPCHNSSRNKTSFSCLSFLLDVDTMKAPGARDGCRGSSALLTPVICHRRPLLFWELLLLLHFVLWCVLLSTRPKRTNLQGHFYNKLRK